MGDWGNWSDELYHHGTLGQKWHFRRYQNPDGSLTALGRIHYGIGKMREKHAEKKEEKYARQKERLEKSALRGSGHAMRKASSMLSDEELKQRTARLNLEKQYKEAIRNNQGGLAYEIRHMTSSIVKKALADAGVDAIKKVIGVGTDKLVDTVKNAVNNAKSEDLAPKKDNNQKQPDNSQKNETKQKQQNKQPDTSQKKEKAQAQQNKKEKNKQTENAKKDGDKEQKDKQPENSNKKQNSYDKLPKNAQEAITRVHNQSKRATREDQFITFGNKTVNLSANRETATNIVNRALSNQGRFRDRSGQSFVPSSRTNKFAESRRLVNETLFENGLYEFKRKQ